MGIFDKIFSGEEKLDTKEAFAAVLVAGIAADGYISEEEAQETIGRLLRTKLYEGCTGQELNVVINKLMTILKSGGPNALIGAAKEVLPFELRETAFTNSVDLVLEDGIVTESEKQILEQIQKSLDIPDDTALKIVDIIMIKNRG